MRHTLSGERYARFVRLPMLSLVTWAGVLLTLATAVTMIFGCRPAAKLCVYDQERFTLMAYNAQNCLTVEFYPHNAAYHGPEYFPDAHHITVQTGPSVWITNREPFKKSALGHFGVSYIRVVLVGTSPTVIRYVWISDWLLLSLFAAYPTWRLFAWMRGRWRRRSHSELRTPTLPVVPASITTRSRT